MTDMEQPRFIGGGPFRAQAFDPSPEWFPELVTPENFVHYWNDVDGVFRRQLARHWLAQGFDSERLRWLATLDDTAVERLTTEQIIGVVRSLHVQFELPAEFMDRCARAIARVQVDLDATGFARFKMRPANACAAADGLPAVFAALPDGDWENNGSPMEQTTDDDGLVLIAAESITDTLAELARVSWPTCARHHGRPMTLVETDTVTPAWHCHTGNHLLAPFGQLTPADVDP